MFCSEMRLQERPRSCRSTLSARASTANAIYTTELTDSHRLSRKLRQTVLRLRPRLRHAVLALLPSDPLGQNTLQRRPRQPPRSRTSRAPQRRTPAFLATAMPVFEILVSSGECVG